MKVKQSDLDTIFEKVAERHNVDPKLISKIYDHEFEYLRHLISNLDYPIFLMHGLGTFHVKQKPLDNYIRSYIKSYRMGNSSYEKTKKAVTQLWQLRRRLQNIHITNKKKPSNTIKK